MSGYLRSLLQRSCEPDDVGLRPRPLSRFEAPQQAIEGTLGQMLDSDTGGGQEGVSDSLRAPSPLASRPLIPPASRRAWEPPALPVEAPSAQPPSPGAAQPARRQPPMDRPGLPAGSIEATPAGAARSTVIAPRVSAVPDQDGGSSPSGDLAIQPAFKVPNDGRTAGDRDASMAPQAGPTIRVTIGRVEVRAITPPVKPARPAQPQRPGSSLSLDDYLARRQGGAR